MDTQASNMYSTKGFNFNLAIVSSYPFNKPPIVPFLDNIISNPLRNMGEATTKHPGKL